MRDHFLENKAVCPEKVTHSGALTEFLDTNRLAVNVLDDFITFYVQQ